MRNPNFINRENGMVARQLINMKTYISTAWGYQIILDTHDWRQILITFT